MREAWAASPETNSGKELSLKLRSPILPWLSAFYMVDRDTSRRVLRTSSNSDTTL